MEKWQIHLRELLRWSFHLLPPWQGTSAKLYRKWQEVAKLRVDHEARTAPPRKSAGSQTKIAHTPDGASNSEQSKVCRQEAGKRLARHYCSFVACEQAVIDRNAGA